MFLALVSSGCSSGPAPETAAPPRGQVPRPDPETGFTRIVSGAGDTVSVIPGSPDALYAYYFRQVEPPSDRFTYRDRELTFFFRPTPSALHFHVENLTERPIWIEWDRGSFHDPFGRSGAVAHASTRWNNRYGSQASTQIPGFQRYSDYVFPMDYLVDPAGSTEQLHRPLFPEDTSAPQYTDRLFGVDLMFRIDEDLRPYTFRFRVRSVLAR